MSRPRSAMGGSWKKTERRRWVLSWAFLPQIHPPGQPGQGERPEGQDRERRVKLQPGIDGLAGRHGTAEAVEPGERGEDFQHAHQRGGEHAQGRKPVGVADDEVKEHQRPAEEDDDLEEIRQRAAAPELAPGDEKLRLQHEAQTVEDEVDAGRKSPARAERGHRVDEACHEHQRRQHHERDRRMGRADEQVKIHHGSRRGGPHLKRRADELQSSAKQTQATVKV